MRACHSAAVGIVAAEFKVQSASVIIWRVWHKQNSNKIITNTQNPCDGYLCDAQIYEWGTQHPHPTPSTWRGLGGGGLLGITRGQHCTVKAAVAAKQRQRQLPKGSTLQYIPELNLYSLQICFTRAPPSPSLALSLAPPTLSLCLPLSPSPLFSLHLLCTAARPTR